MRMQGTALRILSQQEMVLELRAGVGMRTAIFGGSFNPPHLGHTDIARAVMASGLVDRVFVVPCVQHAFNKELAPFDHRLEMCFKAFDGLEGVTVSDVEQDLSGYAFDTLKALATAYDEDTWRWVIGADNLSQLHKWKAYKAVFELAPLIVLPRAAAVSDEERLSFGNGWDADYLQVHVNPISSTVVRTCVQAVLVDTIRKDMNPDVLRYIFCQGLYT